MSIAERSESDKASVVWAPDLRTVRCTDPACLSDAHDVDNNDAEDEAFHVAAEDAFEDRWSVGVTRFDSSDWVLDIEVDAALTVSEAIRLATSITAHTTMAWSLNTARRGDA